MFLLFALEQVRKVIVLGEKLTNIKTDKFGTVAKNVFFSSFQIPIKL